MAVITFPTALESYVAQQSIGQRRFDTFDTSDVTGAVDVVVGVPRWTQQLAALDAMEVTIAGQWDALVMQLRGGVNHLAMHDLLRPLPSGTARGTGIATTSTTPLGATSASLSGLLAGANLLRESSLNARFSDGWFVSNGVLAYNNAPDPLGGNTATTLTRTASGVHYLEREFPLASMASRSVAYIVWLQSGTYTGNVEISVLDGAFANVTAAIVAPTAGWQIFFVTGFMPAGASPNVKVRVASTAAGSAGDTLRVWVSEIDVRSMRVGNATVLPNSDTAPTGAMRAHALIRLATGDHFTFHDATRTVVAGDVYTYSVWLRAGTLTGNVMLVMQNSAGGTVASTTVTPSGAWQRFSVTGTFSGASTLVRGLINPLNNTGSAGDTLYFYGEMINPGATALDYLPDATLLQGDWVQIGSGVGSHLGKVTATMTGDSAGNGVVTFEPPTRQSYPSSSPVRIEKALGHYKRVQPNAGWNNVPGALLSGGHALELIEQWS
jgi:hypothetical protein